MNNMDWCLLIVRRRRGSRQESNKIEGRKQGKLCSMLVEEIINSRSVSVTISISIMQNKWINSELKARGRHRALVSWQPHLSYFVPRKVSDGWSWKLSSSLWLDRADSPMQTQLKVKA